MRAPAFATTALLACLALVGCEKDAVGPVDPDDTATPSRPSTTPTPTGPTPPVLPEAAKANTARGAIAFVEHYIELLNYAAETGDVQALRAAGQSCAGCDRYANLYEKTYSDGGYFRGSVWKVVAPSADTRTSPAVVIADVQAPNAKYKLSASKPESTGKGGTYKLRWALQRKGAGWIVTTFEEQVTAS